MVAVMCSEDAEKLCQKNNLSFVEMVRPFCHLSSEAHIRDPSGIIHAVKNWRIRLVEMSATHPPQHVVNKLLSEVVSRTQPLNTDPSTMTPEAQERASAPWFEAFRDCFFQLVKPSDHEFIRHFLACLIVVSSHHPDPMNAFATMSSQQIEQQSEQHGHFKWFSNSVFKYHLLLHDVSVGEESKAEAVYQSMKSVYGTHACHMLQINSVSSTGSNPIPNLPDPWSQFIIPTSEDTLDWDDDEIDADAQSVEDDPENCAVDENFDPEAAVNEETDGGRVRSSSGPILIGPLTFDDGPEPDNDDLVDKKPTKHFPAKQNEKHHHHLASHYRYFSSRQFSGGTRGVAAHRNHGLCLSLSDHDRIKIFVHELAYRGLLQYIEKLMRHLNDLIVSRKGLHRSIFSATKKWFGGGKPAGLASGLVPGIIYTNDSPELFQRKLGDLAFLVQNYEFAYNCYHTAKRDFNHEHAWFYFAGALEMAAVSAFMASNQRPYPTHYMETSITTYLNACRQHQFAIRATLLSSETLKSRNIYLDAAMQFMRMTAEDSDLLCALFLEQAGHCFLHSDPPMIRKYAFNMILAGHRYSKSAQRKHSLRCYRQALHVYNEKSWHLAEDHIHFTIGRQSFNLRLLEDAQTFFRQLLEYESLQAPEQQASYLREFLFVFKQLKDIREKEKTQMDKLPILPLPMIDQDLTRVIPCYQHSNFQGKHSERTMVNSTLESKDNFFNQTFGANDEMAKNSHWTSVGRISFEDKIDPKLARRWIQLEEEAYESVNITPLPPFFRPHIPCLSLKTDNSTRPLCVVGETVGVEVVLKNPLKIPLNLTDLLLLWKFTPKDNADSISNEFSPREDIIKTEVIKSFDISENETKAAHLTVIPCQTGQLHITGIKYSLTSVAINGPVDEKFSIPAGAQSAMTAVSMLGRLDLVIKGPRLNNTKAEKTSVMHGPDNRLNLDVVPPMPLLKVRFSGFPTKLLCDEVVQTMAEFTNCSECHLENLYIATANPEFFTFGAAQATPSEPPTTESNVKCDSAVSNIRRVSEVPIPGGRLAPGFTTKLPVWIQGHKKPGKFKREVLFYYQSAKTKSLMSYRVLQHAFDITTNSSVTVRATARRNRHAGLKDSSEDQNQLIIALDVESLVQGDVARKHIEFYVVQVSCASKKWSLQPLSHHNTDGTIKVRYGETVIVQFKATRQQGECDSSDELHFSHVCFVENEITASRSPAVDFFFRSGAWEEQRKLTENLESASVDDTSQVDIGLIVFWETSYIDKDFQKQIVRGQSHVNISRLAETVSAVTQTQLPQVDTASHETASPGPLNGVSNRELLVKYSLRHPSSLQVDFASSRLARLVVDLSLHNCCSTPVDVFVELAPSVGNSTTVTESESNNTQNSAVSFDTESNQVSKSSPSSFTWVGQTSRRFQIDSNGTSSLKFNALISLPGVYNINNLRVLARIGEDHEPGGAMILQKPCPPSFVVVENTFTNVNDLG
ncbi:hypothetical protein ACROYT_G013513 [Oculina patagonica]